MSFPLPLIFTAWGFRNGGNAFSQNNPTRLAELCVAHGFKTVAVQLGFKEDGLPWTALGDVRTLRDKGLRVAVWGVADPAFAAGELKRLEATQDDWLPQIEGPGQRDLVLNAASAGLRPAGIVTNYSGGGDGPGESAKLREAGVRAVFVECYVDDGPRPPWNQLGRMLGQGVVYGWRESELVATMGTYRSEQPGSYENVESVGRDFGIYLAEPMTEAQWRAFGELRPSVVKPPPPPPKPGGNTMPPITPLECRDTIVFAARAWETTLPEPAPPTSRLTVCRRIAQEANKDAVWNSIHREVVALLDRAKLPK